MPSEHVFDLCSEGEKIIKTYECTSIKKLFFGKSIGYLTLTNKRILYHATGKSIKGKSLVINEMPVEDVTGISNYMGTSINWFSMTIFAAIMYFIITPIFLKTSPKFMYSDALGILSLFPFLFLWLWNKNVFSREIKANILENLSGISDLGFVKHIQAGTFIRLFYYLFVYGLYILGLNILPNNSVIFRLLLYVVIYFLVSGRNQAFTLLVFSKSSKGAGIYLPGVQQFRIFSFRTNESTAADTMSGSPARDSELVVKELGAIITDLKQMGDFAIEKWQ
jgi:hypothetical protein